MLEKTGIGVWNVLHKASRKGSLDAAIKNEVLNDIPTFITHHPKLKVIAFDGLKAEALFNKYFSKRNDIIYITLPGCSAANARCSLDALCVKWATILEY